MKKTLLASAAIAMAATPALSGGYVEPIVEPEIIIEDTASTAAGIIVPLMLLVLIAAAIATRGGSHGDRLILVPG